MAEVQLQEDLEVPVLTQKKKIYKRHSFLWKKVCQAPPGKKGRWWAYTMLFFSFTSAFFFLSAGGKKACANICVLLFSSG